MVERIKVTEVRDHTERVVFTLDTMLNGMGGEANIGFILVMFPFDGGTATFATNGLDRRDAVNLMKKMISQLDGEVH